MHPPVAWLEGMLMHIALCYTYHRSQQLFSINEYSPEWFVARLHRTISFRLSKASAFRHVITNRRKTFFTATQNTLRNIIFLPFQQSQKARRNLVTHFSSMSYQTIMKWGALESMVRTWTVSNMCTLTKLHPPRYINHHILTRLGEFVVAHRRLWYLIFLPKVN